MLLSKILSCSLIAIAAVTIAEPCLSSDDVPNNRRQANKSKNDWQVVTKTKKRERQDSAVAPKTTGENQKKSNVKPASKALTEAAKLAKAEQHARSKKDWAEIKANMLANAENRQIPGLVERAGPLLEQLKQYVKFGLIKRNFPNYLSLLAYAPGKAMEIHVQAFRHICEPDGEEASDGIQSLLNALKLNDRPRVAGWLMGELIMGGLKGLDDNSLRAYKKFDSTVALGVVELVCGRKETKLLNTNKFSAAFNQLMTLLLHDGPIPRTIKEAQAHFPDIKRLAKEATPKDLDMSGYGDRLLAWEFRIQESGFAMTPEVFNAVKLAFFCEVRDLMYQSRKHLFFQILKVCSLDKAKAAEATEFTHAIMRIANEAELTAVLQCLIDHQDVWKTKTRDPDHSYYLHTLLDICKMLLQVREMGLHETHWRTVLADISRLSNINNLKERMNERARIMKGLPENVRKPIAQRFWNLFVEEQLRNEGYSYFPGEHEYSTLMLELVKGFPEQEMVKAFECMLNILQDTKEYSKRASTQGRFKASGREIIRKLKEWFSKNPRDTWLKALEALTASVKARQYRVEQVGRYLELYPYLGPGEWIEDMLDLADTDFSSSTQYQLMVWYKYRRSGVQEAVHDFWKSELMKPEQNKPLAKLILKGEYLPDSLKDLMPAAAFHRRNEIMEKMRSDARNVARPAAKKVRDNVQEFGIFDEDNDELYQYAIMVLVKTENSKNPVNPYNVVKHHQRVAEEVVDYDKIKSPVVVPVEGGAGYYVTGDVFRGMRVGQVTYAQLPPYKGTYIRDMITRVVSKQPSSRGDMLGASLGGYLEGLLAPPGLPKPKPKDVLPTLNAKLIAIVAHLQGLPDQAEAGKLSPQEVEFAAFMCHAQACETNKSEVIHKTYVSLPASARLLQVRTVEDSSEEYLRKTIEGPFMDIVEDLFSCEKPFLRTLCGLSPGEVLPNASHVELFFKNLLLMDVPFNTKIQFDPYTRNCVPNELLDYKRSAVLELLFSKFIRVEDLANDAHIAIHREMQTATAPMITRIQEFMENHGSKAELSYDDKTEEITISKASVYELLHLLGFFKKAQ